MESFELTKPVFRISEENQEMIEKIEHQLSNLKIDDSLKKDILKAKAQVRSVYSSLAIENNSLSFESVTKIRDHKTVFGEKNEIQEVKNANELYSNMTSYDWKEEADFVRAHSIMMKYLEADSLSYRDHGEGIKRGDKIIYTAPDSMIVPTQMRSLFQFINQEKEKIHPLILSSIFHYYLVYIHPFSDGNGRMARFWITLMLRDYREEFEYIPIEEEIYAKQEKYYQAIAQCHINGNANVFIDFMLHVIYDVLVKETKGSDFSI